MTIARSIALVGGLFTFLFSAGCGPQPMPDRDVRMTRGYVYYCDGAGGGGKLPMTNYAGGVRQGLLDAGYDGAGEMYSWETGLGLGADQTASAEYKRNSARKLAIKVADYSRQYPRAPITLIGLSAGTVIAVFALEELPDGVMVDNAILLSGSLSSGHNLTRALQHVRGRMYVFTSPNDAVLRFLLPLGGTADRAPGTETIGLDGVTYPSTGTAETQRQYAKVIEVPWSERWRAYGNNGGHTDTVAGPFVKAVVAPLVLTRTTGPAVAARADEITNPDYARWAAFDPGSSVTMEGFQEVDGVREPIRMTATLVSKHADRVVVERRFQALGQRSTENFLPRQFIVTAQIEPDEHPVTHPKSTVRDLPAKSIEIGGRAYPAKGRSVKSPAGFSEWGTAPQAEFYTCADIPGGLAQIDLSTQMRGRSVRYSGTVIAFEARSPRTVQAH